MGQRTFDTAEFGLKKKKKWTRPKKFLADIERVMQWARLTAVIEVRLPDEWSI